MIRIERQIETILLPVRVTPRGGKNIILPFQPGDEAIRIKVSAPPEDGKANAAVLALLAGTLDLPVSRVRLMSGDKSRNKRVAVETGKAEEILDRLAAALGTSAAECFTRPDRD